MASANISFEKIPSSIRKPGKYFEFNTKLAARTLSSNAQAVVLIGQRITDGTIAAGKLVNVFDDGQAGIYFGAGSILHLMARAAIKANPYVQLSAIALDDAASGSVSATGTVTLAGTATAVGVVALTVANGDQAAVTVNVGDTAALVATALKVRLDQLSDLPVTAAVAAGVVTLTAKNGGTSGNAIKINAASTAAGVSATTTAMVNGATDPSLTPALTAIFAAGHNIIVSPFTDATALQVLKNHLDTVVGPMEQRDAFGVYGHTGTLSAATTLADSLNAGWITGGWLRGSNSLPCEVAAGYAAVAASEEDPARPLNTLAIAGLHVPDMDQRSGRQEQENALHNGVTPLEVGPGSVVQIVRAITTYTRDPQEIEDVALLDLTTIRTLAYLRKACRERIALRFPRDKLTEDMPAKVRSELLDVLFKVEDLEIIRNVEENKTGLIVEEDMQANGWLNAKIPSRVVSGLHVFAGRIDLLL